jgi:hypothetical protein
MHRSLSLALLLVHLGCPTVPAGGDDDATGDDDDATDDLPALPDPGKAQNDWGSTLYGEEDQCCSTPETAYPVGTVTMDAGYIQGVIDSSLRFFYVFRTSADLDTFTFPMGFEAVHLHDGEGLRFGEVITPSSDQGWSLTWDVEGEHVYAIEIGSTYSGFF